MNLIWKIIRGILIALGLVALICILMVSCSVSALDDLLDGEGTSSVVLEESKTYDFTEEIKELCLEVSAAEVTIRQGQQLSVETNGKYIRCESRNGILTVRETEQFSLLRRDVATVTITIPAGTVFQRVELETGAGQVLVEELRCDHLELDMGAGELVVDHLEATASAELQGGAGRLSIRNGELRDLELDMGVGEVELCSRLLGEADIGMGTGSATLELIGTREDYQISIDTGIGSARLEQENMKDGVTYGSGKNRIRVDGGIGDINIRFVNQE